MGKTRNTVQDDDAGASQSHCQTKLMQQWISEVNHSLPTPQPYLSTPHPSPLLPPPTSSSVSLTAASKAPTTPLSPELSAPGESKV